eukprot:scaffold20338_cov47-Cyclotella_meneghiniana.AAC.2
MADCVHLDETIVFLLFNEQQITSTTFQYRINTATIKIKNAVCQLWPKSKNITKSDVFKLQVKVIKGCLKLYRDVEGEKGARGSKEGAGATGL